MEWISGLFAFFRALPELLSIFREIWGAIAESQNAAEKKKRTKQLGEAIGKAKNEKDTSGLDEFFGVRRNANDVPPPAGGSEQVQESSPGA